MNRSSSSFSKKLYLQDIKELKPILSELDTENSFEAIDMLLMQKLLFSKKVWQKINNNSNFIHDKLYTLYPDIKWNSLRIDGQAAWAFVNNLNISVHTCKKTRGASKYKHQVSTLQGGMYCLLCGSNKDLQVDHKVSVNMGGDEYELKNMQLLCQQCNLGKSNTQDYDTSEALKIQDKESHALRYIVLINKSKKGGMGLASICQNCGINSSAGELEVVKIFKDLAHSYSNLKVICKGGCSSERSKTSGR